MRRDAPHVAVTADLQKIADDTCGASTNPASQALELLAYVASSADHDHQPVAELVRSDRAHVVHLRGPDQRVKDWGRDAGMLEGGYWLDIEGGGIPDDLVMDGGWIVC